MRLSDKQEIVLVGVLADQRELAGRSLQADPSASRSRRGRYRLAVTRARAGLVPVNLAGWLGRMPTASERVLFHREYLRLEGMGLLERVNIHGGRRTTHLRLTAAGVRVAQQLLDEEHHDDGGDCEPIDLETVEFLPIVLPEDGGEADGQAEAPDASRGDDVREDFEG
jgi:hypothetical protein